MKHRITVSHELRDFVRYLPPILKQKIKRALNEIAENPSIGKSLVAELEGLRSYKMGMIRIIYRAEASSIVLVAIGPRKTVYKKITLEIKRR